MSAEGEATLSAVHAHPAFMRLMPHQRETCTEQAGRFLNADFSEQGTGKTQPAILLDDVQRQRHLQKHRQTPTLVITPAIAKLAFAREVQAWSRFTSVEVVEGRGAQIGREAQWVIVNYDLLPDRDLFRRLATHGFGRVILDEAHVLANPATARAGAILGRDTLAGLMDLVPARRVMTGTPLRNSVADLWTPARVLGLPMEPRHEADYWAWVQDTCTLAPINYPPGWRVAGSRPEALTLTRALFSPVSVRHRRADVLQHLPPLIIEQFPVWLTAGESKLVADAEKRLPEGSDDDLLDATLTRTFDETPLSTLRRMLADAKATRTAHVVQNLVDNGDSVLVFGWHINALRMIRSLLTGQRISAEVIVGDTSKAERQAHIDAFQAGRLQVICAGIGTMSLAVTLTRANRVVFNDLSWTHASNEQAWCRAHRIGQQRPVIVTLMEAEGSRVDTAVARYVKRKAMEAERFHAREDVHA